MSFPSVIISFIVPSASSVFFCKILFVILFTLSVFGIPTNSFTKSSVIFPSSCMHLSNMLRASLIAPSANIAISFFASGVISILLCSHTKFNLFSMLSFDIFLKSNLWHLDNIVAGNFCGSVVAKINFTCAGGSSKVLSNALKAPVESIWTSSIIYTLYFATVGKKFTSSLMALTSSTLLLDAASISTISVSEPSSAALQTAHSLQGSPSLGFKQFTALAKILAAEVFPVPLPPLNK